MHQPNMISIGFDRDVLESCHSQSPRVCVLGGGGGGGRGCVCCGGGGGGIEREGTELAQVELLGYHDVRRTCGHP